MLTFTPCVLPMLPILLGVSIGQTGKARPAMIALGFVMSFSAVALLLSAITRAFDFDPNLLRTGAAAEAESLLDALPEPPVLVGYCLGGTLLSIAAAAMAGASEAELQGLVRSTGFYRNKANSLIGLGQALVERFDSTVPHTLKELVSLPGFGRKTANVVLGNAFDIPGITVDTHFSRLVQRWGWTTETDPVKIEHAVGELFERKEWTNLSHRVIFHGRRVCHARKPACGVCVLAHDCPSVGLGPMDKAEAAKLVKGPETDHILELAGISA